MSSQLLRQDLIPMVGGYLIVMAVLGAGLRVTLRPGTAARHGLPSPASAGPLRWRRLAAHVAGTAVGGYLLLMLVVLGYYYAVARVGGAFIRSAFTGCAMLIGLAAPVFALASWLTERHLHPRRPRRASPTRTGPPL